MKRIIQKVSFIACLLCGIMAVSSCGSDDDNAVKSSTLTVNFTLNDGLTADNLSDLKLIVKNDKGMNDTLDLKAGASFTLRQGQYKLLVTGKVTDEPFSFVQGFAEAALFADQAVTITLHKVIKSPLIFKEIFTAGTKKGYLQDSYFVIVNSSDRVQYLDGLMLSAPAGQQTQANAWQAHGITDRYACGQGTVVAFPGSGKEYPIQPRQSVVIANDAVNHKTLSGGDAKCPDLSKADWEIYLKDAKGDVDYPAPNLKVIFNNNPNMKTFGTGVFGRAYILARCPEGMTVDAFAADPANKMTTPGTPAKMEYLMIPSSYVLDAVDIWKRSSEKHYPTFLSKDDAEGVLQADTWSGKAVRRKVAKMGALIYYTDTNNSANDWESNVQLFE